MYCDEYQNTCLLEDKIISAFGEDALEKVIEDGTPEDDVVRYIAAGEALTTDARAKLALGYLEDLKKGDGEYVAMFDIWKPDNQIDSRLVWLPIDFNADGTISIVWK